LVHLLHARGRRVDADRAGRRRSPATVPQRRLGHSKLGITSANPQGIDNAEIIETVHAPACRSARELA
jgi:hypothetical protein